MKKFIFIIILAALFGCKEKAVGETGTVGSTSDNATTTTTSASLTWNTKNWGSNWN